MTTLGRISRAAAPAAAAAVLATVVVTPAAAVPGTASLQVAPQTAGYGSPVEISGILATDAACRGERQVTLQRSAAGSAAWEDADGAQTGPNGSFGFEDLPGVNSTYRAIVAWEQRGATDCEEVVSAEAAVLVKAGVTAALGTVRAPAGRCVRVEVEVRPDKAGQTVILQRKRGGGWRKVAEAVLDTSSRTAPRLCSGWADIGALKVRARWPKQDGLNQSAASPAADLMVVRAPWMKRIDRLAAGRAVGVSVREGGAFLYRRADGVARVPASDQKLLLSMALFDSLGPEARIPTQVLAKAPADGVMPGDLWIVGRGDPELGRGDLRRLGARIAAAGVTRIEGRVMGSTRYFARDWWADGWRPEFPARYIPLPTALTYRGNDIGGLHILDPEFRAARWLRKRLRAEGVKVIGRAGSGRHPSGLTHIAEVRSRPLRLIVTSMNHISSNFRAEVLGKRLGVRRAGAPGTIDKGAAAGRAWAAAEGVTVTAHDSSGLSYANRMRPRGIVRLLGVAEGRSWSEALRDSLPAGGTGTLEDRLGGVPVRAKTGTLRGFSALSGWILAQRTKSWIEFSILSSGMSSARAKALEDAIVRTLWRRAR